MSATIKIKRKPNFRKKAECLRTEIPKAVQLSGYEIIHTLKQRVKKGITAEGGTFRPLSPWYEAYKAKQGKTARFEYSGNMLKAMTFKPIQGGIRLFFNSDEENTKAYINHHFFDRPFFKASKEEEEILTRYVKNALRKCSR